MTTVDIPYFMENTDWYEFDLDKGIYVLTEEATKEAKESYKEFYGLLNTFNNVI